MTFKEIRIQKLKMPFQSDLAKALDMTTANVCLIENGKSPLRIKHARKIVEISKGKVKLSNLMEFIT